ncbi:hypothetical protein ACFQ3W_24335 [Paenibacillus puldeungensis]|uniref:Glycosyltransferase RgtA/B/C/D-like domain-containing protein n=1 Tax=Paenibacillus puldeungensis TaxID=696536 RepID=A0ABW3S4I5_9BACL
MSFASVDASPDVRIAVINKEEQSLPSFTTTVQALFINESLYNDQVYLSYHVIDDENNMLLFEGERVPLKNIDNNLYYAEMNVNLGNISVNKNHLKVSFDLIDEKNAFWFSRNPKVSISSDYIEYRTGNSPKFGFHILKVIDLNKKILLLAISLVGLAAILFLRKFNRVKSCLERMIKTRLGKVICFSLFFCTMWTLYTLIAINIPLHSDAVSGYISGLDFAKGNILLRDWAFNTGFLYTTEVPWNAIISLFVHDMALGTYLGFGLLYAVIVTISMYVAGKNDTGFSFVRAFLVFSLCGIPSVIQIHNTLNVTAHLGGLAYMIIVFILVQNRKLWWATVLMIITFVGDDFSFYVAGIPLLLACIFKWKDKYFRKVVILTSVSYLMSRILLFLIESMGVIVDGSLRIGNKFVAPDALIGNVGRTIISLLELFGANFLDQYFFKVDTFVALLHLIGVFAVGYAMLKVAKKYKDLDIINLTLFISIVFIVLILILTPFGEYKGSSRYMSLVVFYGSILLARWMPLDSLRKFLLSRGVKEKSIIFSKMFIMYLCIIYSATYFAGMTNFNLKIIDTPQRQVASFLVQNNLHKGLADYWSGNIVTVYSNDKVKVRSIYEAGGNIYPFKYISKREWFEDSFDFILIDKATNPLNEETIIKKFGTPSEKLISGNYLIYKYNTPIHVPNIDTIYNS